MKQKNTPKPIRRHPQLSDDLLRANSIITTLEIDETTYIIPDSIPNFRKYLYEQAKRVEQVYKTLADKNKLMIRRIR